MNYFLSSFLVKNNVKDFDCNETLVLDCFYNGFFLLMFIWSFSFYVIRNCFINVLLRSLYTFLLFSTCLYKIGALRSNQIFS